jgi:hypothetical protein
MKTITLTFDQLSDLMKANLKAGIELGRLGQVLGFDPPDLVDAVTQQNMNILKGSKFTPPFRVGRKTKRAVLDANGLEYVVFKEGLEAEAQDFCNYLNKKNQ